MEDIIDIIVTETTNLIEITSQPTDEIIDVNIIDNREDVTLNVTPTLVEININSLTGNFGVNWGDIEGTLSNQTDLQNALNLKADLVDGKVPSSQLPSYVDDVVEVANYAALPVTGEVGKIYITLDTNYIYRWTGSTYVEIKDSSAVWGAITGTLSNQTDLQNSLNAKANDSLVVHLAGAETITGAKTFSSAVIAPNFVLSGGTGNTGLYYGHTDRVVLANYTAGGIDFEVNGGSIVATLFPSGNYGLGITLDAGYKLDVNGTARISGALSGTSASFSNSVTASSIIKSGGTSSQFLKADGSVDSSTYLTTGTAASTYLPLTGGTLTGALSGTSATFTNSLHLDRTGVTAATPLRFTTAGSNDWFIGQSPLGTSTSDLFFYSYGTSSSVFTLSKSTGAATFSSSVTAGGSIASGVGLSVANGTNARKFELGYSTGAGYNFFQVYDGSAFQPMMINNTMYFNTNGNVGIGTTSPGTALAVNSGTAGSIVSMNSNRIGGGGIVLQNSGSDRLYLGNANWMGIPGESTSSTAISLSTAENSAIIFATNAAYSVAERMRITSSGNVGIGTTAPTVAVGMGLVINGGATSPRIALKNNASGDASTDGFQLVLTTENEAVLENRENASMRFLTNATEAMRITSSGNVGIGTTVISQNFGGYTHLDIGNPVTGGILLFSNGNGTNYGYVNAEAGGLNLRATVGNLTFNTGATERMRITSGGTVCIGNTTGAGDKLAIAQSGVQWAQTINHTNATQYQIEFRYNGTAIGSITGNGTMTSYNITSDYRLKEDLKPINGLEIVNKIKVYDYKWKAEDSRMDGVLAHELAEVLPYAVTGVKDGERMQSVDYSKIVPVLIQSIKELKSKLETLENK